MAGERRIECPSLDEVNAVFTTNRTAVATATAFSHIEGRLMPYWTEEPYKSDARIDRKKYELAMVFRIMSQRVDTSSSPAVFTSFEAKIRRTTP